MGQKLLQLNEDQKKEVKLKRDQQHLVEQVRVEKEYSSNAVRGQLLKQIEIMREKLDKIGAQTSIREHEDLLRQLFRENKEQVKDLTILRECQQRDRKYIKRRGETHSPEKGQEQRIKRAIRDCQIELKQLQASNRLFQQHVIQQHSQIIHRDN